MSADLPQGEAKVRAVRAMFDTIAPRYDVVNRVISLGFDRSWRRHTLRALGAGPGDLILDVACGTGDLCAEVAGAGQRPVGLDLSAGMLTTARRRSDNAGGAPLVQGDALRMPFPSASFDGAVSGFALRNVADLGELFSELARVVRPGGRIALLEVAAPVNPVLIAGHRVWFDHVVPRIGALISDGAAYRYLPQSVAYLPPPAELAEALRAAGFQAVVRRLLTAGLAQLLTATRAAGERGDDAPRAAATPAEATDRLAEATEPPAEAINRPVDRPANRAAGTATSDAAAGANP